MRADADDLTMLLVAEGERLAPALRERLVKHGLHVHDCDRARVADTAFVVAPDLVVLAGIAAEDGGLDVLAALAARPGTAGLPVVLIGDPGRLGDRSSPFRHGIVAIIERTASADELARRIAEVAHELPERTGEASGAVDAGGVQALVELLAESLRTGILSVTGPDGVTARVVLRADRPASEVIAQIVERLRPLADAHGGVRYEFHESPTGKLGALDLGGDDDAAALSDLPRSRLLLIEQNPARSDLLAQGLRAQGARVAVADGLGRGLELARDLTPDVVIVDGSAVDGWALEALRKIRRDPALRWASLLLVEASRLWQDERRPDVAMLATSIGSLMRSDRELARRLLVETEVGTRLEVLGPVRTLRALAETKLGLRMRVQHPRIVIDVDLSDGIVVGASARLPNAQGAAAEGPAALATLLGLSSGRVQIERAEAPRSTNIMSPVDDAIAVAANEEPVVALSQPPPSLPPPEPTLPPQSRLPREAGDVASLVTHLEQLLGELRGHAEPSASLAPGPRAHTLPPAPAPSSKEPTAPPGRRPAVLPEETTTTVGVDEIARLRKQMRDSAQRLRAVTAPVVAPPPAPPVRSHKPTLLGVPIDVTLPPAEPSAAKPPLPASLAAKPPSPGLYRAKLPPRPALPAGKLPPPKPGSVVAPLPSAALPSTALPSTALPSTALPSPALPSTASAEQESKPEPPSTEADASEIEHTEVAPRVDVHALADRSGDEHAVDDRSADVHAAVAPEAGEPEFGEADFAALDSPPAPTTEPPRFFSLMAPSPVTPHRVPLPAPPLPASPMPAPQPAHADRPPLPLLAPSDPTPVPARARAPQARSKLPLVLGASAVGLALLVGMAFAVRSFLAAPAAPIPPIVVGGPLAVPITGTPPSAHPAPPAAASPPGVPRAVGPVLGPGPDQPIEGSDADFDLARLGIERAAAPSNRRVRVRLFARLLRQANQARRQRRLEEAVQIYKHVLGMDPENGRATAGLSLIHLDRGEPAEAIFWAQRLVRLQSVYASHWVLLGDALRVGNNVDGARRAYSKAILAQASYGPAQQRLQELSGPGR